MLNVFSLPAPPNHILTLITLLSVVEAETDLLVLSCRIAAAAPGGEGEGDTKAGPPSETAELCIKQWCYNL